MSKKFPIESCREKIARRHGLEAVALSGPCAGMPLAECVCKQLGDREEAISERFAGDAGKITRLAMKVADSFMTQDDTGECVEALSKLGLDKEASADTAEYLRAYAMEGAMEDEMVALMGEVEAEDEPLADEGISDEVLGDIDEGPPAELDIGPEGPEGLEGPPLGEEEGTVTLELDEGTALELMEQVSVALDEGAGPAVDLEMEVIDEEPGEGPPEGLDEEPEELDLDGDDEPEELDLDGDDDDDNGDDSPGEPSDKQVPGFQVVETEEACNLASSGGEDEGEVEEAANKGCGCPPGECKCKDCDCPEGECTCETKTASSARTTCRPS
jgi:hypothetical protein